MLILGNLALYLSAFFFIWVGSGFIISSINKLSHSLHISSFAVSFFLLGLLTSTPEIAVGLTAVSSGNPEIFVGNLLGGVIIIFLFIIPVLAVLGGGLKLSNGQSKNHLLLCLLVSLAPSILILDRRVTNEEGFLMILLYGVLFLITQRQKGLFGKGNRKALQIKTYSLIDILKILGGVVIVLLASNIIVDKTIYFATSLAVSPFVISLLALSFGTNLPELSIAVRSIFSRKKEIAFGDYLGSAAANTLLFGVFTILNSGEVITATSFYVPFVFMISGLALFYYFTRSKNDISRSEGFILFMLYLLFVAVELIK